MWRQLELDAVKKPRTKKTQDLVAKTSKRPRQPKTVKLPAGLSPEMRELLMQAAFTSGKSK
jgi:hypothetical protein